MSRITVPTSQPQPNQAAYGLQLLNMLSTTDRASYKAETGIDADTMDPSLPPKTWQDLNAPTSGNYTYITYIDGGLSAGAPKLRTITIPGSYARALNMPGIHSYAPYVIAATNARTVGDIPGDMTNSPIVPLYLSMKDDAIELAGEWGLNSDAVIDGSEIAGLFKTQYPADELRRLWLINFKGTDVNAGQFLEEKNHQGVGAPGKWDVTSGVEPNWISSVPTTPPVVGPPQPVPMRQLMKNEAFNADIAGWEVVRTDLPGTSPATPPAATAAGLTDDQSDLLTHIGAVVDQLAIDVADVTKRTPQMQVAVDKIVRKTGA